MRAELKEAWSKLGSCIGSLDKIQVAVRRSMQPQQNEGRVTPFWGRQSFIFGQGDVTSQRFPLVSSAGRVTKVTRLTYSVQVEGFRPFNGLAGVPPAAGEAGVYAMLRPNPRGLVLLQDAPNIFPPPDGFLRASVFDFEWSFSKGSTERDYAQGRTKNATKLFLSRSSLGNPEDDRQLLFSEKHPLVLKTNEFFTVEVRPIFNWLNWDLLGDATRLPDEDLNVTVNISYAGYRTFGYE